MRGHRFLARSVAALGGVVVAGRLVARRDLRRPDPAEGEPLGSITGQLRVLRGAGGARIYTEWFPPGPGGRGTLVLTHGLCLTEAVWHYQKRDLSGGPFALVTWDLPGHGRSDLPAGGRLSRRAAVDALARVLAACAEEGPAVLLGHSLGGILTLDLLSRRPAEARAVRGAVLVSTPMIHFARSVAGRWPGASVEARVLGGLVQAAVGGGLADRALAADAGRPETSRLSYRVVRVGFGADPSPAHVRFVRDVIASVPRRARADAYRAMSGYDIRPRLARIRQPALVVIGTRDRLVNPRESRALARSLPRGETLELAGTGHAAFLEAHEAFNERVSAFAEDRLSTGARSA